MDLYGNLYIISAPSGAGKTTLVSTLIEEDKGLKVSVSHTTRKKRASEIDGMSYFFVNELVFQDMINKSLFLEYANVFENWYGTSKKWVLEQLASGLDVILEIDWQGAQEVKRHFSCISIMILPPSKEELLDRLNCRKQDPEEVIKTRIKEASFEMSHYIEYDYIVLNDSFNAAVDDLKAIIRANRKTLNYQKVRLKKVIEELIKE